MLIIRLFRTGKKRQPTFKIVVTDKRNPPSAGRFVDEVGFYNPVTKEKIIKEEKINYWVGKGAQTSDTVHNLLIKDGIIKGKKKRKHKVSKKKNEEKSSEQEIKKTEKAEEEIKQEKVGQEEPKQEEVGQEEPKQEEVGQEEPKQEEVGQEEPKEEPKKDS